MGGFSKGPRRLLIVTEFWGSEELKAISLGCYGRLRNGAGTRPCTASPSGAAAQMSSRPTEFEFLGPPHPGELGSRFRRNPVSIALAANRLFWLLRQWRPQIVHFYLPGPYLLGAPLAIVNGAPIKVMSRRSLSRYQQRRPFISRIEPALHRHMDAVIGNSKAVVKELQSEGIASDKIHLIYNGIESSIITPDRTEARRRLGLDPQALVGVVVANLISYKGHLDLIEALGQVALSLPAGWRVFCAGRDQGSGANCRDWRPNKGLQQMSGFWANVPTYRRCWRQPILAC